MKGDIGERGEGGGEVGEDAADRVGGGEGHSQYFW